MVDKVTNISKKEKGKDLVSITFNTSDEFHQFCSYVMKNDPSLRDIEDVVVDSFEKVRLLYNFYFKLNQIKSSNWYEKGNWPGPGKCVNYIHHVPLFDSKEILIPDRFLDLTPNYTGELFQLNGEEKTVLINNREVKEISEIYSLNENPFLLHLAYCGATISKVEKEFGFTPFSQKMGIELRRFGIN